MAKPSANMILSQTELINMVHEQNEELYKSEQDRQVANEARYAAELERHANYVNEYYDAQVKNITNRASFLEATKNGLLTIAISKVLIESMNSKVTDNDKSVIKGLVSKFINEQGAGNLLNRFKYQNTFVAELGRIVQESYDQVVDSITYKHEDPDEENIPGRAMELKLGQNEVDDFYKELSNLDTAEASTLIRNKVEDAMNEFIDQNVQNKIDFQEVINSAKERIDDTKEDEVNEAYISEAKRQINEMRRTRRKNIFQYVVEAITREAFKDESLKTKYIHESNVNMNGIIHSAEIIYTMLEMLNTTEMASPEYIKNYIISLTE